VNPEDAVKPLAIALALTTVAAGSALAGPPHIRVTLRGHPTAGGFVTLTTFHHGTQMPMTLIGTAEGLVGGRRSSAAVRFEAVADTFGVYVVPKTWGDDGVWVLNIGTSAEHGGAGVVVGVDRTGSAAWDVTPRTFEGLSRRATAREVDAMLAALEAGRAPPQLSRADVLGFARRNPPQAAFLLFVTAGAAWVAWITGRGAVRLARRSRAPVAA
jgi:hypothetical protein